MSKKYLGIDIGGTYVKGGIIDEEGLVIDTLSTDTHADKGADFVIQNIIDNLCLPILAKSKLTVSDIEGIGVGIPGIVNSKTGTVPFNGNLQWRQVEIVKIMQNKLKTKVLITNDANAAALGEAKFGASKEYKDSILITLGTGLGSGIVADGKLFEGYDGAGAEIGHMAIVVGGKQCTCGRKGCFEAYSSASALIKATKEAMEKDKQSVMWKECAFSLDNVSGKTAFEYKSSDKGAREVVDNYIKYLGEGLVNLAAIFRPQVIILGGGVSKEGDNLIIPLQRYMDENIFAGSLGPRVLIKTASLGNSAGFIGAAALLM
ncbi:MAG: ROK family protein [Firmicutes bacterium]|jgi:glucokinase|nr:ROK family protein [Bacillota bacterium]